MTLKRKHEKRVQLVRAIQEYIQQEDMSPTDLYKVVTENGGDVSETTIRRIAKADPEMENFSLDVLQRVSAALFKVNEEPIPVEKIDSAELAEKEALRAVTALTDAALQEAQARIVQLEAELSEANFKIEQLTDLNHLWKEQMIERGKQVSILLSILNRQDDLQKL